jgi:hypothetical protein
MGPGLKLTYVCADGEEGYPGQLTVHVSYQMRNDNDLSVEYDAVANTVLLDQPHRLKFELSRILPSFYDLPPVPQKHLTRCLQNRQKLRQPLCAAAECVIRSGS